MYCGASLWFWRAKKGHLISFSLHKSILVKIAMILFRISKELAHSDFKTLQTASKLFYTDIFTTQNNQPIVIWIRQSCNNCTFWILSGSGKKKVCYVYFRLERYTHTQEEPCWSGHHFTYLNNFTISTWTAN